MIDNTYELIKVLGKGGSSKVFLATTASGQRVAVKAIRKDKSYCEIAASAILEREHEILNRLEGHPNIIKSFSSKTDGLVVVKSQSERIMYNVIEFAKNGALSNFVRYTGALNEHFARLYALQL